MKLNLVHDREGQIMAASVVSEEQDVPMPRPLPGEGQTAAEIDLPDEQSKLELDVLCTTHRVDGEGESAKLVPYK